MAIRMMTGPDEAGLPNVETVHNYPGHETGMVSHDRKCPNAGKYDKSGALSEGCLTDYLRDGGTCFVHGPLYMKTTHEGLVLSTGEYNGYDDSDFYAVVWNPEKGETERVTYASTRGWTYPNSASVDATPEVLAAYEAWSERKRAEASAARAAAEAKLPKVGRTVKVVKGRKVPKGTVGRVFWAGKDKFKRSAYSALARAYGFADDENYERVGLELANGTRVFTAGSNVEVVSEEAV